MESDEADRRGQQLREDDTVGKVGRQDGVAAAPTRLSRHCWATIQGKVVCFLEATSELVDWKMIDAWLKREFPSVRKVNAMNFGSELNYVK